MKLTILSTEDAQDSEFYSFFGRIQASIICFRDLLTFMYLKKFGLCAAPSQCMDNLIIHIFVQRCEISVSKCFQQKTIVQKGAYFGLATQIRCSNRCIRSYCRSHSGTYSYSPRHSLRIDSKTTSSGNFLDFFIYLFLDCVQ